MTIYFWLPKMFMSILKMKYQRQKYVGKKLKFILILLEVNMNILRASYCTHDPVHRSFLMFLASLYGSGGGHWEREWKGYRPSGMPQTGWPCQHFPSTCDSSCCLPTVCSRLAILWASNNSPSSASDFIVQVLRSQMHTAASSSIWVLGNRTRVLVPMC